MIKTIPLLAVGILACGSQLYAQSGPAHIWLSDCLLNPSKEAPVITGVVGSTRQLHIWAQPATTGGSFRNLQNFSLNLVGDAATVDLLDETSPIARPIIAHNPLLSGPSQRYEFVSDSSAEGGSLMSSKDAAQVAGGAADSIKGLAGFSLNSSANGTTFTGFGPACDPGDAFCGNDGSKDAWLIGTVSYMPLSTGTTNFSLQIGLNGIKHAQDANSADTDVVFGTDGNVFGIPAAKYNAEAERELTRQSDTNPELTVNAVPAAVPTAWNGTGSDWGSATWTVATPTPIHNAILSPGGGEELLVSSCEAANHTNVVSGRLRIDSDAALASPVTVAAAGTVSGGGWISANLDNSSGGTHAIDDEESLRVLGTADVTGALLTVTENYSQTSSTITSSFNIIEALDVTGSFATVAGDYLGRGIFLASIAHSGTEVSVSLRNLPGDFDGDNDVDRDDLATWKGALGTIGDHPADGNLNGLVDAADYGVWLANLGGTAVQLGVGTSSGNVPEPASVLALMGALFAVLPMRLRGKRVL